MEDSRAAWAYFGILVGFKAFTLGLIVVLIYSAESVSFLIASHVLWILVGLSLAWMPALFWLRLVRVRIKRKQLQQQEWLMEKDVQQTRL